LLKALLEIAKQPTDQAKPAETGSATHVALPTPTTSEQQLDVRRIQSLLSDLGHDPGPIDGKLGRRTAAAIKAFQEREGMVANGRPTAALLAALESRASATDASPIAPADEVKSAASSRSSYRLGQLALTGESVIRFRDDLVTPNVNVDAVFKQAQVNNLDSRKTQQPTEVSLAAEINEFTQAELSGWINGLSKNADFDLSAKVANLSMSTYSPYIEALARVYVESGRLDTRVAGRAAQGALQGEIELALDKLRFRPLSREDAERVANEVGVPLDTAVKLLQDSEGHIALKLPLSGTVSEPDVDISSAVDKAIGGALREVFPPYMVASLMSSLLQGDGAKFEPIGFAPGSAELDQAGRRYADRLVEFLAQHPKLSVNICGRSTAQDLGKLAASADAPEPATAKPKSKAEPAEAGPADEPLAGSAQAAQLLEELAIERKRAVRRYLVNEKGLDAARIGECGSSFEAGDQGDPRVEIFP
jgi:peptidoglycan hydrolase-like protein with peptidoglycan-binding domain